MTPLLLRKPQDSSVREMGVDREFLKASCVRSIR